jgi:hypothetical protein
VTPASFSVDAAGREAVEHGTVFRQGDRARRLDDHRQIVIPRPAIDRVELGTRDDHGHTQLHEWLDAPLARLDFC